MSIALAPDQEVTVGAYIAAGDFASIEEAARQLLDGRIAELDVENDDLAWAKLYVDDAREGVARGEFITLDEHRARNAKRLAALSERPLVSSPPAC